MRMVLLLSRWPWVLQESKQTEVGDAHEDQVGLDHRMDHCMGHFNFKDNKVEWSSLRPAKDNCCWVPPSLFILAWREVCGLRNCR